MGSLAPDPATLDALADARHRDPFSVLGPHAVDGGRRVVTIQPRAEAVELLCGVEERPLPMTRVHEAGIFVASLPARLRRYRLRLNRDGGQETIDDPYRFDSTLGDLDRHLMGEGTHRRLVDILGAHLRTIAGVAGTRFAVWAPNATRVSVVGDFNDWDGRRHPMRLHPGNGLWEIFLPGVRDGARYKFELRAADGRLMPLKTDPVSAFCEAPPGNASIVFASRYAWGDDTWMAARSDVPALDRPMSIYEVHLGSWRRKDDGRWLSYRELADELVAYVADLGYTHVELLPVSEHPFDGSWGYQPIGLYAPTHRFGDPDDFRFLVDAFHRAGIGVIVDWVPAHFPRDPNGLARFDGTALYEHQDPRRGEHRDWGTLVYNYGRREVANYLIGSALAWIDDFHIDGLRVDAVASMLYLDYSREAGEWEPNEHGGNENLEAIEFLKHLNTVVHAHGGFTCAEESTAWPGVSRPVDAGGLGFTYKWNMGWMNDTLAYMGEDPVHRRHHHDRMTFGLVYAFDENFILPLSHDEVVHGKRSLLGRMPGDGWRQFANLRAYYAFMIAHPGKKLLFMGGEFAQRAEWNHDRSLDWHELDHSAHAQLRHLVRDLNHLYRATPALYELDFESDGFEWVDRQDREASVLSWLRRDSSGQMLLCVVNFTPVVREAYRVAVPLGGPWREVLNSDAEVYGGSGVGNQGRVSAEDLPGHDQKHSLALRLPPLACLLLTPEP